MEKARNFVDGQWTWPAQAGEVVSVNPADTRQAIATAPDSPVSETDRAVAAARQAFSAWRRTPPPQRAALLREAGRIMADRKQVLGETVTRECGKPIAEGLGEVQEAIDMAELAAGEGRRLFGQTTPSELPDKLCLTYREPVGVCGLITPWNFPIAVPSWKMLHALICGNTVVLKPAEQTPLCAVQFVQCLEEAGIPPGVVNILHGRGETAGAALVAHPDIDLISFTGSTETGRLIAETCGRTGKHVSLECGGKNAQIVMADADLDLATEGALWGAFGTAGQRCTATSRLIVDEQVHDELLERLVTQSGNLKLGDGLDPDVHVGPIIDENQFKRVLDYIEIGRQDGATLVCGGSAATKNDLAHGHFIQPTIFAGVTRDMRIFREEIFGPVLSVILVSSLDQAIETLNDCEFGLSSSIYTRDVNGAMRAMREIEAGIVYVNGPTIGAEVHLPFGGVKATGNGHREAGATGLDIFTEWKTVYLDYSGRLQKAQIDTN